MPSEPDIANPPAAVQAEVARLAAEVDKVIPRKRRNRNLLIGTWNLRAFGGLTTRWKTQTTDKPKRNLRDLAFIVHQQDHLAVPFRVQHRDVGRN